MKDSCCCCCCRCVAAFVFAVVLFLKDVAADGIAVRFIAAVVISVRNDSNFQWSSRIIMQIAKWISANYRAIET